MLTTQDSSGTLINLFLINMGVCFCVRHVQGEEKQALHVILEVPESFSPTLILRPCLQHGFQQRAGQLMATLKPKRN